MFLTVHSVAGIAIGQAIANPAGAFFAGFISHYILDIIPHGDETCLDVKKIGFAKFLKVALADNFLMVLNVILLFVLAPNLTITYPIAFAFLGAVLPDYLGGGYLLTKRLNLFRKGGAVAMLMKPFNRLHRFCHLKIIHYEVSFAAGLLVQFLFLAFFWRVILLF